MNINKYLADRNSIKIYGSILDGSQPISAIGMGREAVNTGGYRAALIKAFSVGRRCVQLPMPIVLVVDGDGEKPEDSDPCASDGDCVWAVLPSFETYMITYEKRTIFEHLENVSTQGVSGGLQLEDLHYSNGQVCGTVHFWWKIEEFGQKAKDDKRIPFCISTEACWTHDMGIANLKACLHPAANGFNVCVKACLGKWGIEQCWDECQFVVIPSVGNTGCEGCNK